MKSTASESEATELRQLLEAIHLKFGYDFSGYAVASVKRRLLQAREFYGCESFADLRALVLHGQVSIRPLLDYLTVQVSEMFRDPQFFLTLRQKVVPHLRTYPSLKVWVAGCSDGEELYSLAILFREEGLESRTIFYATDINPEALARAEAGVFPLDRVALYTQNHQRAGGKSSLSDYYTAAYRGALFDKSLRKQTVFSDHSLVSDSVFAEVHLVCCRNVLIYFTRELQDRAIGLFKDSLVRKGFLGLGAKESLHFSTHSGDFSEFAKAERIYQKESA